MPEGGDFAGRDARGVSNATFRGNIGLRVKLVTVDRR
jgi:hypothetical protein